MSNWIYFWNEYNTSLQLKKQKVRVQLQLPWGSRLMYVIKLASCNYGFEKEFILTHIINIASLGTEVMSSLHKYPCKWDSLFYSEMRLIFIFYWKVFFALNVLHWQTSQYEDKFSRMLNFKWKKLISKSSLVDYCLTFISYYSK